MASRNSSAGKRKNAGAAPVQAQASQVDPVAALDADAPVGEKLAAMEEKVEAQIEASEPIQIAETPAVVAADDVPVPAAAEVQIISNIETAPAPAGPKKGVITMNEAFQQTTQNAAEQIRATFGDVNEHAKTAMERNARMVEELTDLTRGNVEALVASSKVAARGVEAISQEVADYSRRSFEEVSNTMKSFAEVRSATDFFKLQSDFARSAFDGMVAETAKMSETVIKLAGDVAEPLTSRAAVAAERVKTIAA